MFGSIHKITDDEENYREFLHKGVFYLIDMKKLQFTLNILRIDMQKFLNMNNLKNFFEEFDLLAEEFLEFISVDYKKFDV